MNNDPLHYLGIGAIVTAIFWALAAFIIFFGPRYGIGSFGPPSEDDDARTAEGRKHTLRRISLGIGVTVAVAGVYVGGYLAHWIAEGDRTRVLREIVAGTSELREGDPVPTRVITFDVPDPTHEFKIDVSPSGGGRGNPIDAVIEVAVIGPDSQAVVQEELTFRANVKEYKYGQRVRGKSRQEWSWNGKDVSVTPVVAGTHTVVLRPTVVGIPKIYVNIYDLSK